MKEKSSQEKIAANRQVELLSEALSNALQSKGYWLNTQGKTSPKFYPKGCEVSPFNALIMGLHADKQGYKTNLYTLFNEAKNRNEGVREGERGIPFNWYAWNKYVNRHNPDEIIPRKEYLELPKEKQAQFKGVHNREIRFIFNIDQTILPMSNEEKYEKEVARHGGDTMRKSGEKESKALRMMVNEFKGKMQENLMPMRRDGSGIAHYDSQKDAVYMPKQENFEHYNDYAQEMFRQVISATGNQQRLAREGMVMKNGVPSSEDAIKQERLVVELASGVKMMELGLPARLSEESVGMVDYWKRELKENPCLIDAIESDVNNALDVVRKAEKGEKVQYSSVRNTQQTAELQEQLPKHYYIAEEIKNHPSAENKMIVVVRDKDTQTADVVLPAGASLEVNNELPGLSKERIKRDLVKKGFENVNFFNVDGILGYHPDDSYFDKKEVTVARLNKWDLEDISKLNITDAVAQSNKVGFDKVQMIQDDEKRWAMFIKPEGKQSFAIYPDRSDLNRFFTTLKQAQDGLDNLRVELAEKYYAMSEVQPELKVDLFHTQAEGLDLNRIQKVNVFRGKNDALLCAASIDGVENLKPRIVSTSQWQRMWIADDVKEYKKHLAATLFADVLKKGQSLEQTTNEKQETETEQKQGELTVAKVAEDSKQEVKPKVNTEVKTESTYYLDRWTEIKAKHPDAVILLRTNGSDYKTYKEDATKVSSILGIEVKNETASFPYHALDSYLPKLIREGCRVAICDELESEVKQNKTQESVTQNEEQRSGGMRR